MPNAAQRDEALQYQGCPGSFKSLKWILRDQNSHSRFVSPKPRATVLLTFPTLKFFSATRLWLPTPFSKGGFPLSTISSWENQSTSQKVKFLSSFELKKPDCPLGWVTVSGQTGGSVYGAADWIDTECLSFLRDRSWSSQLSPTYVICLQIGLF